jgi:hypothetical protein
VQIISKNLRSKSNKSLNNLLYLAPEQMQFINLNEKEEENEHDFTMDSEKSSVF